MIQVVQSAVVLLTVRLTHVQERSAQELIFNFAGELAGRLRRDLQLFVRVVMQADVLTDFVVGHAESGRLNDAIVLARLRRFQAEILEVVDALRIDELHILAGRPSIGVAENALHVVVVVFDRATHKVSLRRVGKRRKNC